MRGATEAAREGVCRGGCGCVSPSVAVGDAGHEVEVGGDLKAEAEPDLMGCNWGGR